MSRRRARPSQTVSIWAPGAIFAPERARDALPPLPGPPGILSVTPDTPEMLEWRSRSALDIAESSSTFLDDDDDGA
jgi:hypothetical protein